MYASADTPRDSAIRFIESFSVKFPSNRARGQTLSLHSPSRPRTGGPDLAALINYGWRLDLADPLVTEWMVSAGVRFSTVLTVLLDGPKRTDSALSYQWGDKTSSVMIEANASYPRRESRP